jgi:hypothetical protein
MALSHNDGHPEILGNIVRVRMITGDRNGDLKHMVSDLALYHPNPRWQQWARDQVELTKFGQDRLGSSISNDLYEQLDALPLPIPSKEQLPTPELRLNMPGSILPKEQPGEG